MPPVPLPTMRRVTLAAIVGAVAATAIWSWNLGRRLVGLSPRPGSGPAPMRRSYVFGGIGRQAFDAAMKKTRRRSRNRPARGTVENMRGL